MNRKQLLNIMGQKINKISHDTTVHCKEVVKQATLQGKLNALAQLEHARERIRCIAMHADEQFQKSMMSTSLKAAQKIIVEEINNNPLAMINLGKQALLVVKEAQKVRILVHPTNHHLLVQHKDELIESLDVANYVDIREDSTIEPGGIVVHTEVGSIDAQPNTLVSEIARVVLH